MQPFYQDKGGKLVVQGARVSPYPEHLHTDVEILYLFNGSATITVDGHLHSMEAGDLSICFPGVVHGFVDRNQARGVLAIFQPSLVPDFPVLLSRSYPLEPVIRRRQLPVDVALCMERMLNESAHGYNLQVLRGYIQVVLAFTIPLLTLADRAPEMSDIVYNILKYISVHYRDPITLENMSHALGVSKSHLSHSFSERIGVNFRNYVNTLRANEARNLLRSTTESVLNIALECGFESQRTFNRVFMELYGLSPSEYRRQG